MLGRSMNVTFPEKAPPAADAPVGLSVRGLTRAPAIEDVSFDVRAGEIVGLAGLIGSGRSEVARAIFGADGHDGGTIELDGAALSRPNAARRGSGAGIAMLPEYRKAQGLLMRRSIVDNMTLPHLGSVSRGGRARRRQRAADGHGADASGVDVRAASPDAHGSSTLSGGNQQKVLFAKWLFRPPRVFIADEPTRGVDVGAKRSIYELIRSLAGDGMAVLLISSEHRGGSRPRAPRARHAGRPDRRGVRPDDERRGDHDAAFATHAVVARAAMSTLASIAGAALRGNDADSA